MIRVLLEVSSPALRAGLSALLSADPDIRVVNNSLAEELDADVIIRSASHASIPTSELDSVSSAAVLFLNNDPLNVRDLRRSARAWGVLPTDASADELSAAVHALSQGLIVGTAALLFETESEHPDGARGPLTERETEVLGLLSRGLANKQIAAALGISEHTVKFHVSSIYTKLNVTNRTEAVREGLRGGWVAL